MHNHRRNPNAAAMSATAQTPAAGPSPMPSAAMPMMPAAIAVAPEGLPTPTERPSCLAGATNRMNSAMLERAPICAATITGAASTGSAMLEIAADRNSSDRSNAHTPYVPTRLSRMISSLRSRVLAPNESAKSARPSSCKHPVAARLAAIVKPAAASGGSPLTRASQ